MATSQVNLQRSQNQPLPQLSCPKHNELIKGVCLFPGNCNERLICRMCRRLHDNNHLNHYEEFEDALNGNLVRDTLRDFQKMIEKIDAHNFTSSQNCQLLVGQVEGLFKQIQNHILQKLVSCKNVIIEDIHKKFKSNNSTKQDITTTMSELDKIYSDAVKGNFKPIYLIENLVQTLKQAQAQRDRISNDPELNSRQAGEMTSRYLSAVTSGTLFTQTKISFERICQTITDNLVTNSATESASLLMPETYQPSTTNYFTKFGTSDATSSNPFQTNSEPMHIETSGATLFPEIKAPLLSFPLSKISSFNNSFGNTNNNTPFRDSYINNVQTKTSPFGRDSSYTYNASPFQKTSPHLQVPAAAETSMEFGGSKIQPLEIPADINDIVADIEIAQSQLSLKAPQNSMAITSMYLGNTSSPAPELAGGPSKIRGIIETLANMGGKSPFNKSEKGITTIKEQMRVVSQGPSGDKIVINETDFMEIKPFSLTGNGRKENSMQVEEESKRDGTISPSRKHTTADIIEILKGFDDGPKQGSMGSKLNESLMSLSSNTGKKYDPFSPIVPVNKQQTEEPAIRKKLPQPQPQANQLNDSQGPRRGGDTGGLLQYQGNMGTGHKHIGGMVYVSVRQELVTGGDEGVIQVFNLNQRKKLYRVNAHNGEIFRLLYIEEKDFIVSCSFDGLVSVWDCKNQYKHVNTYRKHKGPVYALEFLSDMNLLASGGEDGYLHLWSVETLKESDPLKMAGKKIGSLCYMKENKRIAIGFDKGQINIVSLGGNVRNIVCSIPAHSGYVLNMKWMEEQKLLVTGSEDGYVKIWKLAGDKANCLKEFGEKGKATRSFIVDYNRDLVMSNHADNCIRAWKVSASKKIMEKRDDSFGECLVEITGKNKVMTGNKLLVKLWELNG